MVRAIGVVLSIAFVLTGAAHAQTPQPSITLDGTTLRLGATQASVLQQLGQDYDLSEMQGSRPDSSSWLIKEKGTSTNAVGSVYFKNRRLHTVYKYWTLSEPDTQAAFANDLYGAILSFEQERRTLCTIQTAHKQEPKFDARTVFLTCGSKYLRIDIVKNGDRPESVSLAEIMESQ